jgi:DNA-binding CsgD family transcriptional regulator
MVSVDAADEGRTIRQASQADFLETRFSLTPAQARLVIHLVKGDSLQSSAKALGIKYESARSCLKLVFRKTGTHRQAELVLTVFSAMSDPNPSCASRCSPSRVILG